MHTVLEVLGSLSLTSRVFIAVGLVVVVAWVWTSVGARWRDRSRTVYEVDNGRGFAAPRVADRARPPETPPDLGSEPEQVRESESEAVPPAPSSPRETPAPSAAVAPAAPWSDDWAEGRKICPGCDYATDFRDFHRCSLCGWAEPPEWGVDDEGQSPPERKDVLADARARYRATGWALSPEDRDEWLGPLTATEIDLRGQLQDRLEYLRSGDRPDTSETWETIARILDRLHQEQERKALDA